MTGRSHSATRKNPDPLAIVQERLRDRANEARATRSATSKKSREKWLGVDSRTVSSAHRQVNKSFANDPDALFYAAERLLHGARFREEKALALSVLAGASAGLCDAHLVRCLDWFAKLQDQDLIDQLASSIGATVGELPAAQRKLTELARNMNPLQRRAAVQCATEATGSGIRGLRAALLVAEIAAKDRSPQVREALCVLMAALSQNAPKQAMPFLVRYADDLPNDVFSAALSTLPASQRRQLQADRASGDIERNHKDRSGR